MIIHDIDAPPVVEVRPDDWYLEATPSEPPKMTPASLPPQVKPVSLWDRYPSWVRDFGRCVMRHESGGDPRAENPISTASGLFQFVDGTWQSWAARARVGTRYLHAAWAPVPVQIEVFAYAVQHKAQGAWMGTGCGYGT